MLVLPLLLLPVVTFTPTPPRLHDPHSPPPAPIDMQRGDCSTYELLWGRPLLDQVVRREVDIGVLVKGKCVVARSHAVPG